MQQNASKEQVRECTPASANPSEKPIAASRESLERISSLLYTARALAFDSHDNAEKGEVRASVVDALGELIDSAKGMVDAVIEGVQP
jgi:hypothetical protein